MFKNDAIRWLALELFKQLDRLDVNNRREQLDKLIEMLTSRRDRLKHYSEKAADRYEIKNVGGTYVVYKNGVKQKGSFWSENEAYESLPDSED